jgi:hypothetical protein
VSGIERSVNLQPKWWASKKPIAHGVVFVRLNADHHAITLKPGRNKTGRNIKSGLQVE